MSGSMLCEMGSSPSLIPMDLVMEEILTRLPSKSLMRFKSVSKLWSSHIRSPNFSNHFPRSRPHPRLYLCIMYKSTQGSVILSSTPDSTSTPSSSSFVIDHDLTITNMVGFTSQTLGGFMCNTGYGINPRIFNPATRQLITLPFPPVQAGDGFVSYSFGHSLVNDQYKVVCSTGVYYEHWVFALKPGGGSWKKLAPTPTPDYQLHKPVTRGLCIDGVIYYVGQLGTWSDYVLVSFHFGSEEFKTIQVEEGYELPRRNFKHLSVIEYGGKVTILNLTNLRNNGTLDLLILEDAENKEWSRKTVVLQPCQLRMVNNLKFKVNYTTQNGKVYLIPQDFQSTFHVLCYDLQSNDMRKIEIKGIPTEIEGIPYHWISMAKGNMCIFDLMFMDQGENVKHLET